jgi:hypothetical protein
MLPILLIAGAAAANLPIVDLGYQRHQAISFNVSPVPMRKKNKERLGKHLMINRGYTQRVDITSLPIFIMPNPRWTPCGLPSTSPHANAVARSSMAQDWDIPILSLKRFGSMCRTTLSVPKPQDQFSNLPLRMTRSMDWMAAPTHHSLQSGIH